MAKGEYISIPAIVLSILPTERRHTVSNVWVFPIHLHLHRSSLRTESETSIQDVRKGECFPIPGIARFILPTERRYAVSNVWVWLGCTPPQYRLFCLQDQSEGGALMQDGFFFARKKREGAIGKGRWHRVRGAKGTERG